MATIQRFEDINSWKEARILNQKIGALIDEGRFKHSYKLITQIEGSAGSIMDNIAEDFERGGNKEFIQFLYIAKGSCGEFKSQLYRAIGRKYLNQQEFDELADTSIKISGLLQKLIGYLENSGLKGHKYYARTSKEQP